MTILTFKQRLLFLDWPILVVKELLLVKRSKETELIMNDTTTLYCYLYTYVAVRLLI